MTDKTQVTIYSSDFCGYCYRAKHLLNNKDVAFEEINVDTDFEQRQQMVARAGATSVPQIFINDKHIGGCDELYELEARGELDAMLAVTD